MNKEKIKDLIEKYEKGESTLLEEQIIFDNADTIAYKSQAWFKFVQRTKKKAPEGLQASIWESIHKKRIVTHRLRVGMLSAAASIIILLSITMFMPFKNTQSYKKKEALLKEALGMFENKNTKPELMAVYEDDMIIIYVSAE